MEFVIIRDFEILKGYKEEWEKILRQNNNNNPFTEFEWIEYWWKYLGKDHGLFVIMIKSDSRIIGFCPLMLTRKPFCTEVNFIGYADICYMDLILYEEHRKACIEGLADFLHGLKKNYVFNIHGLTEKSADFIILMACFAHRGRRYFVSRLKSYYVDTGSGDFEGFYKRRCRHKSIKNISKHEKKLCRLGNLCYREVDSKEMETVFKIHDKRWHKKNDGSSFSRGTKKEMFKQLATESGLPFKVKVGGLFLDDRLLAFQYSFLMNRRFVFLRIAHDDTFAVYGPGRIMYKESIKDCFENDFDICEFGAGGFQRDKAEWTDEADIVNRIVFPAGCCISQSSYIVYMFYEMLKVILKKYKFMQYLKKNILGVIKYYFSAEPYRRIVRPIAAHRGERQDMSLVQYYLHSGNANGFIIYENSLTLGSGAFEPFDCRIEYTDLHDIERIMELMHLKAADVLRRLERGQKCAKLIYRGKNIAWFWIDSKKLNSRAEQDIRPIEQGSVCIYDCWIMKFSRDRNQYEQVVKCIELLLLSLRIRKLYFVLDKREKRLVDLLEMMGYKRPSVDTAMRISVENMQKGIC